MKLRLLEKNVNAVVKRNHNMELLYFKGDFIMKKILGFILVAMLCLCLSACGNSISGENVVEVSGNVSRVWYHAKCPYCNHVNDTMGVNLSEGEEYEATVMCKNDDCCKLFDISIKR